MNNINPEPIRWYAIVGDNGFAVVNNTTLLLYAINRIHNVEVQECATLAFAQGLAYGKYVRFFNFRHPRNTPPCYPSNFSENSIFIDSRFEEGKGTSFPTNNPDWIV